VSEEIWYRVVQIVTNHGDELQRYAAQEVWQALASNRMPHRTLVKIAGYILGEFGHTIADGAGSSAEEQLRALHEHFVQAEPDTKALLLNTYAKLSHAYGEISAPVGDVMRASATAMDQEVQQRSVEYLALGGADMVSVKGQVLEMMPHFTERESIVQKTLSKSLADINTTMHAKTTGSSTTPPPALDSVEAPNTAAPAVRPSLVGDDTSEPDHVTATNNQSADLLGQLHEECEQAGAVPPTQSSATNDLLNLIGSAPANAAGSLPSVPDAIVAGTADGAAHFAALCLRNDGVLHEDGSVQVGVKMEFQAHQGRIAIFIGNKSAVPLVNMSSHLAPHPALLMQPSPLTATVAPRQQQSQVVLVQCGGAYGDPPQLSIEFDGPTGPCQLELTLPLPPTKFIVPLDIDGPEFFRRWKGLEARETQVVFNFASTAAARAEPVLRSLNLASLKEVDPAPTNFVAAGWLAVRGSSTQADSATLLARLEVNQQASMCRMSVRSFSEALCVSVSKIIEKQLSN
jgi:AP-2 complex subunit alpha